MTVESHVHVLPERRIEAQGVHHLLVQAGLPTRLGPAHDDASRCAGVVALCTVDGDASEDLATARSFLGQVPVLLVTGGDGDRGAGRIIPWVGASSVSASDGTEVLVAAVASMLGGVERACSDVAAERPLLTRRESEIAQLIVSGWRNDEIAQRLGISPHTVRTHTQRLRLKLDVQHRLALAAKLPGLHNVPRPRRPAQRTPNVATAPSGATP